MLVTFPGDLLPSAMFYMPRPIFTGMMLHPELQQLWKEVASQSGADPENGVKGGFNGLGSAVSTPSTQAPSSWTNGLNSNYLPAGKPKD